MVEIPKDVTTRIICEEREWDALRDDWNTLYASSPYSSPPLDFVWLRGWWRVYGTLYGKAGLRIVTVWRGSRLVGAIPLYMGRGMGGSLGTRHLRFISTGEEEHEETCPDYLNLLCLPGEEAICADAIWGEVGRLDWDHLEFLDLMEDSPLLLGITLPHDARSFSRGSCPIADLTDGFEEYLKRLSLKSRQQARRVLREGEAGAHFEVADVNQAAGAFDDLVRLHQERWTLDSQPGVFASTRFTEFHRKLIQEWLPSGRAVLARLSIANVPVAVLYGFVNGLKFELYQLGVRREPASRVHSPGILANLLLMRALTERGMTAYDFLRGSASYKVRLATRESQLVGVRIWRPTLRAAIHRSGQLAVRVFGKGQQLMRRS
ncbi:MAG TPA: GNAT family N-acetyltransferase [Terriglobales bacterium]|nr:GNAT family N-acetyltransferase [Terriglobales bacterium]